MTNFNNKWDGVISSLPSFHNHTVVIWVNSPSKSFKHSQYVNIHDQRYRTLVQILLKDDFNELMSNRMQVFNLSSNCSLFGKRVIKLNWSSQNIAVRPTINQNRYTTILPSKNLIWRLDPQTGIIARFCKVSNTNHGPDIW